MKKMLWMVALFSLAACGDDDGSLARQDATTDAKSNDSGSSDAMIMVDGANDGGIQHEVTKTSIGLGRESGCYVESASLYCWGDNSSSQLGDGTTVAHLKPHRAILDDVRSIDIGFGHACGVKNDGSVWCWGANESAELGNGNAESSLVPTAVQTDSGPLSGMIEVSLGEYSGCARGETGDVYCWGPNEMGQTGQPAPSGYLIAKKVPSLKDVTDIALKAEFACAISSGKVFCWGEGPDWAGMTGPNADEFNTHLPSEIRLPASAKSLALSDQAACAILDDGRVFCWGDNTEGELGDGSMVADDAMPHQVSNISNALGGEGGERHICIWADDGSVWCWGGNTGEGAEDDVVNGKIGQENGAIFRQPVKVEGFDAKVVSLASGDQFSCAITETSSLMCWGRNIEGELGSGQKSASSAEPLKVVAAE